MVKFGEITKSLYSHSRGENKNKKYNSCSNHPRNSARKDCLVVEKGILLFSIHRFIFVRFTYAFTMIF